MSELNNLTKLREDRQMIVVGGQLIDWGIDWITLSQVVNDVGGGEAGRDDWELNTDAYVWSVAQYLRTASQRSNADFEDARPERDVKFGGYRGVSWDNGHQRVGQRYREGKIDVIYQASGGVAGTVARELTLAGELRDKVKGRVCRITRLDEQLTIKLDWNDKYLAADYYDRYQDTRMMGRPISGRRGCVLYRSDRGDTVYIGSRSSKGDMFRVYDKSSAYEEPKGSIWRFEIEHGQKTAKSAYLDWADSARVEYDSAKVEYDRVWAVAETFTRDCGIVLSVGGAKMLTGGALADKVIEETKESELEARLSWLKRVSRRIIRDFKYQDRLGEVIEALELR